MSSQLPALQIVLPLALAPVAAMLPFATWAWAVALIGALLAFICSVLLTIEVFQGGVFHYEMGGWSAPWGISITIDSLNVLFLLLVSGCGLLVLLGARASIEREVDSGRQGAYYTAYITCLSALLGIVATSDAFNVFVFLEIASLSTYALLSLNAEKRALLASFRYLIVGTVGATFILISIGLMYQMTGTLNMADLADRLPEVQDSPVIQAALAFFVIGVGIKAAMYPLYHWLPSAYTHAPSISTAFIGATATKVSIYIMIRFLYTVFDENWVFIEMAWQPILSICALLAIVTASGIAVFRVNTKKLLAYSSVAQLGYIMLPLALVSTLGLMASILHGFHHGLIKAALFMALAGVLLRLGSIDIHKMAGAGPLIPWTMGAFVAGGISLIGLPTTVGFISKWYLILALLESAGGGRLRW